MVTLIFTVFGRRFFLRKIFFHFLFLSLLSFLFLFPSLTLSHPTPDYAPSQDAQRVMDLVNFERQKATLSDGIYRPNLIWDNMLSQAALYHSQDMLRQQYFEHEVPLDKDPGIGRTPSERAIYYGYISSSVGWAENLFYKSFSGKYQSFSPEEAVNAWMGSPGHRANILNPKMREMGLGIAYGVFQGLNTWMVTQMFGYYGDVTYPSTTDTFSDKVERVYGLNRYQTSVEISKKGWTNSDYVVLATGANFPDALASIPLSYAYSAPILLTYKDKLPQDVEDEIKRLQSKSALIIGGTSAISECVAYKLSSLGLTVTRIWGLNRYETAANIARKLKEKIGNLSGKALVASGENYPDALASSAFAAYLKMPILLVSKDSIPFSTLQVLSELKINETIVIGGEGVISSSVLSSLPFAQRIYGTNRYETAKKVAEISLASGMSQSYILMAAGSSYPDALAGGAYAAKLRAIILLVYPSNLDYSPPVKDYLLSNKEKISKVYILGGQGAIPDSTMHQIDQTIQ